MAFQPLGAHIMSPLAQGSLPQYDSLTFLNLVTMAASHGTTKLSSVYEPSRGVQLILCCNVIDGFWVSRLSFTGRFHVGFGFKHWKLKPSICFTTDLGRRIGWDLEMIWYFKASMCGPMNVCHMYYFFRKEKQKIHVRFNNTK